uniref:Chromosome 22 open reading frame 15 n=1 Tax=Catagonus wagneri TaxID=51154 RepID=A0A8C3W3M0_9CETA
MFITVMFGAGSWELVNPWCSLVTLMAHLRQKGQVSPDATIALLAEDGHLVNLGEGLEVGPSPATSTGSVLLQEHGTYILVQVIKGEAGAPTHYEPLLENLDDRCPELAEELYWLSGLPTVGDGWRRRVGTRHSHQEQGPPSRPRRGTSL